jgi:hypothetical protein
LREINLVEDLHFNKKYKEINGFKDNDNYTFMIENCSKTVFNAEEIVNVSGVYEEIIDKIVFEYEMLFSKRNSPATKYQLEFAKETAKILLGELKDINTIPVIPAPCGFGKSTITYVFIKEICKAIRAGLINEGIIIVTDKLEELKKIHSNLINDIGFYKSEIKNNQKQNIPFTYVLESWTEKSIDEGICLNKKVKSFQTGMCSSACPFFSECKMSNQKTKQKFAPILLMTNARLETFGENINQYNYYINENINYPRTMIINDEKPVMIDSIPVSISLMNNIQNDIYKLTIINEQNKKDKETLIEKWKHIRSIIEEKLKIYSNYERFLVSNINNEPILLNDQMFTTLWDKYMGIKYKNELIHIHSVLTKGGLYCNTKRNGIFINTISMKKLINPQFKTVIFDATALVDPDYANTKGKIYEDIIKFVDIESFRSYKNLTFNFYQNHKINKTQLNSIGYLTDACVKFIESMPRNRLTYTVTYKEFACKMMKEITKRGNVLICDNTEELWGNTNKVEMVSYDTSTLFYFGNTKGSNKAKDCTQMIQFGWNVLPDYIYTTRYLCTDFTNERLNKILTNCATIENGERFSKWLSQGENYKFENPNLYLYQNYSMLTGFIQEVFRTKLRNYNNTSAISIHCFKADSVLIGMIKQLFPDCKINIVYDELNCFEKTKLRNRGNGQKATILDEFIDNWELNKEYQIKDISNITGLTKKDIDNLKCKNSVFKKIFEKYRIRRGLYKKVL